MADQKITQLTELDATPDDADILALVDDVAGTPVTKKITIANLLAGAGGDGLGNKYLVSTDYATVGTRTTNTTTGSGAISVNTLGMAIATNATATSSADNGWRATLSDMLLQSPSFSTHIRSNSVGTDFQTFHGLGDPTVAGAGITYTVKHIGFKLVRASNGDINLYATQADDTTENASGVLTTFSSGDALELILQVNGSSSVDYYWRKNGGVLSSATNLTSNMPASFSAGQDITHAISNVGVATATTFTVLASTYIR